MISIKDVTLKEGRPKDLLLPKHEKYLKHYAQDDSGSEQIMAEYLKMSGMYWGLNALFFMKSIQNEPRESGEKSLDNQSPEVLKALKFIKQCQSDDGGYSAAPNHDSHILHTLSAVQILTMMKKCHPDYIDAEKCVQYISSLQQKDGSFFGDKWGEVDTRFSFCALACLRLLGRLDAINLDTAVEFVMSCNNQIDGGFGSKPGSESHSAYVYCCVGSLAIANQLHRVNADELGWWLSERQLPSGGLNGRPEKLPDLCYSWWCLASMKMINKMDLIDHKRLLAFILACQDEEQGGFSDRPGNWVDPYHTMFGIASVSLISHHYKDSKESGEFCDLTQKFRDILRPVNEVFCMPEETLAELKL